MSWMFATCFASRASDGDDFCTLGGRGDRRFRLLACIGLWHRRRACSRRSPIDFERRGGGNGARRAPMRVGLLQVVTEDAGELLRPIGRLALQPIGEPFVETSTVFTGHAV